MENFILSFIDIRKLNVQSINIKSIVIQIVNMTDLSSHSDIYDIAFVTCSTTIYILKCNHMISLEILNQIYFSLINGCRVIAVCNFPNIIVTLIFVILCTAFKIIGLTDVKRLESWII